tara:strand:- start:339 stop:1370 length:1032 start_codon:yes stop_codon:yes gene_type:complete
MPVCKALENQVHVTIDGFYKPCCAFAYENSRYPITEYTPQEYLASDYINKIKDDMLTGWHNGCNSCEINEKNNNQSMRHTVNFICRKYDDIQMLDLNLNNQCNLTCRMCNSLSSSKWEELLGYQNNNYNDFDSIVTHLPKLKHIKYQGGEPFITKEIQQVLEYIAKHNCQFSFSTNCTLFPLKYINLLNQASSLFATFSIDGVGVTNDYIRHGKYWNTIDGVFNKWMDYFEYNKIRGVRNVNTVVQAYNFHDLGNIVEYLKPHKVKWNGLLINDIPEFTVNALPEKYIEQVINDVNSTFLTGYKFNHSLYIKLRDKTYEQDKLLQRKVADYNPLLHKVFTEID